MKTLFFVVGFVIFGNQLFGQELIYKNFNMSSLNMPLTVNHFADTKMERDENSKWPGFVLNLLLGLGIGSFVQGDTVGGIVGLCGQLGGLTLLLVGAIQNTEQVYHPGYYYSYYTTEVSYPNIGFSYVGIGIFLGTRIFELIRPFTYANSLFVAFSPSIDVNGQPILAAMVRLKL